MASSGGGGGAGDFASLVAMAQAAQPMANLPIAGSDSATGDPYNYGQFQNFLPDAKATGQNDVATGLRPDMFRYRKPNDVVGAAGGGGPGPAAPAGTADASGARDALAQIVASGGADGTPLGARPAGPIPPQPASFRSQLPPGMMGLPGWQGSGPAGDPQAGLPSIGQRQG